MDAVKQPDEATSPLDESRTNSHVLGSWQPSLLCELRLPTLLVPCLPCWTLLLLRRATLRRLQRLYMMLCLTMLRL